MAKRRIAHLIACDKCGKEHELHDNATNGEGLIITAGRFVNGTSSRQLCQDILICMDCVCDSSGLSVLASMTVDDDG